MAEVFAVPGESGQLTAHMGGSQEWDMVNKKRVASQRDLQAIQRKLSELKKADSRNKIFTELQNEFQKLLTTKSQLKEKQIRLQHKIQFTQPATTSDAISAKKILGQLTDLEQQQGSLIQKLAQIKSLDQLKKLLTETVKLSALDISAGEVNTEP